MLDTDTCSYVLRQRPMSVLESLQDKAADKAALVISSITYSELRFGALRSGAAGKHQGLIDDLCECLNSVLAWDKAAADRFAHVQAGLFAAGTPIGDNDAMIAGHALSIDATVVSNNQRHFQRVPNLALENWVDT